MLNEWILISVLSTIFGLSPVGWERCIRSGNFNYSFIHGKTDRPLVPVSGSGCGGAAHYGYTGWYPEAKDLWIGEKRCRNHSPFGGRIASRHLAVIPTDDAWAFDPKIET